jgi:putative transposase
MGSFIAVMVYLLESNTGIRDTFVKYIVAQLFDGTRPRVLTIVDAYTKVSPAIDVRQRYCGADVVETLERVTALYGLPKSIRVDQGPEFISKDLDLWAWSHGSTLDFSRPGKPTDNAFIESFNGKVRAECIDQHWFLSLDEAPSPSTQKRAENHSPTRPC